MLVAVALLCLHGADHLLLRVLEQPREVNLERLLQAQKSD